MNLDHVVAVRSKKTIYRDGDMAIKLFDSDYLRTDVLNEALNQARAEKTNLNVPKIYEVAKHDGKWVIISEFIEGQTLSHLMQDNPEKFDEYLELFVKLQMQVHNQRSPMLSRMRDKIRMRLIALEDLDATTRFDLIFRLEDMPRHNSVCHGDFHPSNIIIKSDGTPYILDWSHAVQGSGAADLAITYLMLMISHGEDVSKQYLDIVERIYPQIPRREVLHWLPIAAASLAIKWEGDAKALLLSKVDYNFYR